MHMKKTEALAAFIRAAHFGCDDLKHTLFHRAIVAEMDGESHAALLEEFVSRAECDARKLPEACYRLAMVYGIKGPSHLGAARRFCDLGVKADRSRLAVFPDEAIAFRKQARALLRKYQSCGNTNCAALATLLCASCKAVNYCSRECQLKEWKAHKAMCKQGKKNEKKT